MCCPLVTNNARETIDVELEGSVDKRPLRNNPDLPFEGANRGMVDADVDRWRVQKNVEGRDQIVEEFADHD